MNTETNLLLLNQEVLDVLEESICVIDKEYKFVIFNKPYADFYNFLYGVYPEVGKQRIANTNTVFGNFVQSNIQRGFKGERFKASKEANGVSFEFSINPFYAPDKTVQYLAISCKEITQTLNLMKTVSEQDQKYKYVVENIADVLYQTDEAGNWTFLNHSWTDIFEFSVDESIGTPFNKYIHPDDLDKNALMFFPLINRQKISSRYSIRYITKSGKIKWIKVFATLLLDENDKIVGTTGTLRDITNEKINAHLNELLLQNARDLICIHNTDGSYMFVSPSIEEITGFKAKDLIGKSPYEFIHPDDIEGVRNRHKNIVDKQPPNSYYAYRFLKKNGDYVWVETISKLFFDEYEISHKILTSTREINERKLAEEGMIKALQKEKELNQLKTRFVAMTAHEFKTPLSTISSSAEIIEMYAEKIDEEPKSKIIKQLNNIHSEIVRITNLMNESLFLGKIEEDNKEVQKVEIDLVSMIKYVTERQNRHQKDGRRLSFEIIGKERKVFADAQHLEHIIDNLVSNAFKYSQQKDSPKVSLFFNDDNFQIYVTDYGIGIPQSQQKKVYSSFFRGSNVGGIKGTGLGLLIVYNLVKMNEGTISFESQENVGTTFKVQFPYE